MNRLLIQTILRMCGEAALIAIAAGIIVGIIGYLNQWDTALQYSNAFFIAGSLVIIAGLSTKMAAGQEWGLFQRAHTESFRNMSPSERASFIVDASSSVHLVILGLLSGILLILISMLVMQVF